MWKAHFSLKSGKATNDTHRNLIIFKKLAFFKVFVSL